MLQEVTPSTQARSWLTQTNTADEITQEQRKQLEQKHSFAPTLQEIRGREKANMLEKGKRPTQNVLSNLNE